jgi:mxaK protein
MGVKHVRRIAVGLGIVCIIAAAVDAVSLVRAHRWNAQIEAGAPDATADAPPPVRFAQAHAQAASGAPEAALNRYGALQDDSAVGRAARYNAANLLMRQAVELREGPHPGQALPLVELAKEHYRELLRRDPAHWNARYNLERAQRLVPDPEEAEIDPASARTRAERAMTTMRGHSPGLP